ARCSCSGRSSASTTRPAARRARRSTSPRGRSCSATTRRGSTGGAPPGGAAVDIAEVKELQRHYKAWLEGATRQERERAWHAMLELHTEQQFTIGIVSGG